ncbi:MAG TPA: hypothetical protein VLV16_04195 [Gemmatimonadales bacterium]|nr:hypothetical protein [Gemmatimonadales bacterium]
MWYYKYTFLGSLVAYALIIVAWVSAARRHKHDGKGQSSAPRPASRDGIPA